MDWPTPQDYNEALQSPQVSFADPELKQGQVETDKLGLPRPISGRFAVVYKMQCNGRTWAVRCFQSEVADQQQRYAAISDHLNKARLPYTVVFDYLLQGIRVKGKWFPILKMEWIVGKSLNAYVEAHLEDPAELMRLSNSWMRMTEDLRRASIAHGDLQDGNVLVEGGKLKLIDYDGMFVPALVGRLSNESGHRNYQHPSRSAADFDLYLDNFSNWVIYVSLVALTIDPTLWTQLKGGDECMLFRKSDYEVQHRSDAFHLLSQHADARLRGLVTIFKSLLILMPAQIPTIAAKQTDSFSAMHSVTSKSNTATSMSWLDDHIKPKPDLSTPNIPLGFSKPDSTILPIPTVSPNWILDFITLGSKHKNFEGHIFRQRVILLVLSAVMVGLPLFSNTPSTIFLDFALAVAFFSLPYIFYTRDPAVQKRSAVQNRVRQQQVLMSVSNYEQAIRENEAKKVLIRAEGAKTRNYLSQQRSAFAKQEGLDRLKATQELKDKMDSITQRANMVSQALPKLKSSYRSTADSYDQQLAMVNTSEGSEIAASLKSLQDQFIKDQLFLFKIENASLPGIGEVTKIYLRLEGYVTAADLSWNITNIYGIGDNKASMLMGWRRRLKDEAEKRMPTKLSNMQLEAIISKYEMQRNHLLQQKRAAKTHFEAQEQIIRQQEVVGLASLYNERIAAQQIYQTHLEAITNRYRLQYEQLDQQDVNIKGIYDKKYASLDQETARVRKDVYEQNWQLARMHQEADAYKWITFSSYLRYLCLNQFNP